MFQAADILGAYNSSEADLYGYEKQLFSILLYTTLFS